MARKDVIAIIIVTQLHNLVGFMSGDATFCVTLLLNSKTKVLEPNKIINYGKNNNNADKC